MLVPGTGHNGLPICDRDSSLCNRLEYNPSLIKDLMRLPWVGGDLYWTSDGVYWEPVFADGLGNSDNHSIRTLKSTDLGLFVGTENPFTQLEV